MKPRRDEEHEERQNYLGCSPSSPPSCSSFLRGYVLLFLLAALSFAQPARRPNILLILSDDQGYGDLSLHGNPYLTTPHIDRFAKGGIQFERFFVSPLCAPTRAALLTGRYSLRTGVWGVTHNKEAMRPEETTIAEILKGAGYRTGIFGKWHNGEQFPYTPPGQGFDEFLGFHNGHWNNYFDSDLLRGTQFVKTKGYITDVLTDEAMRFMTKHRAQPFFAYVPFNAPHAPYQVPDKYFDKYKAKGLDDTLASVYGMVENIDDNVARLLAHLDALKLRENTIVIFMTDNGAQTDRFNAGMRGRKGSVHEGGSRVPFFLQFPARFKTPRTVATISAHIDVLPTLLELCNVALPQDLALDGRSLVPLLENKPLPERTLFVSNNGSNEVKMFPGAARTQQYRLVNEGRGYELYDLLADSAQKQNLAKDKPEITAQLSQAYEAWFRDVSKKGFTRFPIPVGYAAENPVLINAPQASFTGKVRFQGKQGWANDWLTDWTNDSDEISWELEVVKAGDYEIELRYLAPDIGSDVMIAISDGKNSAKAAIAKTTITNHPVIPDRVPRTEVPERNWVEAKIGKLTLSQGRATLRLTKTGSGAVEVKALRLHKR
ncbi:MAG: arylsulfatase [Acidobacteria bacterium]|nr:arylsulfatase [Acidobacteriota bacterium]